MLAPPTANQSRLIWLALSALALALLLGLLAGVVWALGFLLNLLSAVLWPLAVAGIVAYLLDPLVDFLARKGLSRPRALLLVFISAFLLMIGAIASWVPQIYRETHQFADRVPSYSRRIQEQVHTWATNPPVLIQKIISFSGQQSDPGLSTKTTNSPLDAGAFAVDPEGEAGAIRLDSRWMKSATSWVANIIPEAGSWLFEQLSGVSGWFGLLAGLALIPIYAFYFLLEKNGIEKRWTDYLPLRNSDFKDEMVFVLRSINDHLIVFFRSQLLVALCDGVLYTIGFLLIGLPYAFLIGTLSTFLTMIPFLGAIITFFSALIIGFASSGSWQLPAGAFVVFFVVQVIEGLVITPKIMSERVGLHPLTILIAVMVGTTLLGGLLGGILAIPLTAALKVLMFRYVWKSSRSTNSTTEIKSVEATIATVIN